MSVMGGRHAIKGQLNGFPQSLGAHQALNLILSNPDFPEPKPRPIPDDRVHHGPCDLVAQSSTFGKSPHGVHKAFSVPPSSLELPT